jgi:hypothetical protein
VLVLLLLLLKGRNAGLPEFVTEAWLIAAVEPRGTVAAGEGYVGEEIAIGQRQCHICV